MFLLLKPPGLPEPDMRATTVVDPIGERRMDWIMMFMESASGALGANISGKLVRPQELGGGSFLNTVLGIVAGLVSGHFAGQLIGSLTKNPTAARAATSALVGFFVVMIFKKIRYRSATTI